MKLSFPDTLITVMIIQRRYYHHEDNKEYEVISLNPDGGTTQTFLNNPYVDKIAEVNRAAIRLNKGIKRVRVEIEIVNYIRKEKFDIVFCTFPQDRFVFWAYLSGAKIRVGERNQKFSWLLTHTPNIQKEEKGVLRYYCALVEAVGAKVKSYATEFRITDASRKWANDFLKKHNINESKSIVCIHPGASGFFKTWPPERFAAIADSLQSNEKVKVVLCGTEFDKSLISEVKKHLQEIVIEIDFGNSIDRFAAILERSVLCITNDSGPRHLAVAVGIPTISFMSRMKHLAWKIYEDEIKNVVFQGKNYCPMCSKEDCREIIPEGESYGAYCIRMIAVEEVLEKIAQMIPMVQSIK
jgi:ADP-heptose:LPS heptosyltransferase